MGNDFADYPNTLNPNDYQATSVEVINQGRYDPNTRTVSSYPELVVYTGTGYVGITAVTEYQ